jgi:hypothetical protein
MSTPNTQMIGVSHVAKAKALLQQRDNKAQWPYWWLFPPFSSSPVNVFNGITLPDETSGVYSLVCQYNVPSGEIFVLTGLIFQAVIAGALNSAFAPGDGSVLGLLDVNNPLNSPVPVGAPVKGFQSVNVPLGSFTDRPFPLSDVFVFDPLDIIRWKVTNVSLATDDVFVAAGLFGYTIPQDQAQ